MPLDQAPYRLEMPPRERALARIGHTDQHDEGKFGDGESHLLVANIVPQSNRRAESPKENSPGQSESASDALGQQSIRFPSPERAAQNESVENCAEEIGPSLRTQAGGFGALGGGAGAGFAQLLCQRSLRFNRRQRNLKFCHVS